MLLNLTNNMKSFLVQKLLLYVTSIQVDKRLMGQFYMIWLMYCDNWIKPSDFPEDVLYEIKFKIK